MSMREQVFLILLPINTHLILVLPNGICLETKGFWRPEDRRKIRQVINDNPEIDLRMIFQDPYKKNCKKIKDNLCKMVSEIWN